MQQLMHSRICYVIKRQLYSKLCRLLPCPVCGASPPELMARALDAGAAEVQVIRCAPFDCTNREGKVWTERRLLRKRVPRLHRRYTDAPITAKWVAPDQFADALRDEGETAVSNNGHSPIICQPDACFPH
jgi:hypothetical protein